MSWPPFVSYLQGIIWSWHPSLCFTHGGISSLHPLPCRCRRALLVPFPGAQMVLVRSSPWEMKGFIDAFNLFGKAAPR